MTKKYQWAVLFGKFMPPHIGHEYLISLATELAHGVTVFVGNPFNPNDEMPSTLRAQWLAQHFGDAIEVVCPPEGDADTVTVAEAIERGRVFFDKVRGERTPDILVGADDHTKAFASLLGAKPLIADTVLTTRATNIRPSPLAHWDEILPPARAYFLKEAIIAADAETRDRLAMLAGEHDIPCLRLDTADPGMIAAKISAARRVARRGLLILVDPAQLGRPELDHLAPGPSAPGRRSIVMFDRPASEAAAHLPGWQNAAIRTPGAYDREWAADFLQTLTRD